MEKLKEFLSDFGGCGCMIIVAVVFGFLIYRANVNSKIEKLEEKQRADSIRNALEQHRNDSIKAHDDSIAAIVNSKEYKDSVALAQYREDVSTIVIVVEGDDFYHYSSDCIDVSDMKYAYLTTRHKADKLGLDVCYECEDRMIEHLKEHLTTGEILEYFDIDVLDYVQENYFKSDIIELFDITEEDLSY